ncbi:DgyrCDS7333 [Dimorphilus gyrociliatus]|uniref:DgyrCDS7333 n=1 Tax=Dimorphilus gyrociliatus TaxID=2664684 RepID=A0A7I8VQW7_9ANNE|nr:DgyrCDS7333 [Dimorphilus gyrociliatus]
MARFETQNFFTTLDYTLFGSTLIISLGIGVFSAIRNRKDNTTGEYLMGGRKLKLVPVTLSILVTFVSAIGILGNPAEVYLYGTQFSLQVVAMIIGNVMGALVFVPLYYPLKLTSSFEYFTLRFEENSVKNLNILMSTILLIILNGVGVFAPAIALQSVTGLPSYVSIIACIVVGTIYTTVGGMQAVIWTDVFQSAVIFIGLMTVSIKGIIAVGGFKEMWETNDKYNRIEFFNIDPDPTIRTSFWSICFVMPLLWVSLASLQPTVQRYSALTSIKQAQYSLYLSIPGFGLITMSSTLCGLAAFAFYAKKGCDPIGARMIYDPNQILPLFVMELMGYSGIPGLFVACLFSASLSTLSSTLNALAAVFWDSIIAQRYPNMKESTAANLNKLIVGLFGLTVLGFAIGFQYIKGTLIEIFFSVIGSVSGPVCACLLSSASFPWISSTAIFISFVVSFLFVFWMNIGSMIYKFTTDRRPSPIFNCPMVHIIQECMSVPGISANMLNGTIYKEQTFNSIPSSNVNTTLEYCTNFMKRLPPAIPQNKPEGFENFYAVTYLYYPAIGIAICITLSCLLSLIPALKCQHYVKDRYLFEHARAIRRFCNKYRTGKEYPYGSRDFFDEKGHVIINESELHEKFLKKQKTADINKTHFLS